LKDENRDILEWVKTCVTKLDHTYATFVKFAFLSGLRKSEAITAFNLAIKLNAEGKLKKELFQETLDILKIVRFQFIDSALENN
jgi:NADH:ubiquinone oxidoreductase subunit H